jgi:hypothetical protein
VAEFEHISNLERRRNVSDAEVVAVTIVNANCDTDISIHGRNRVATKVSATGGRSRLVPSRTMRATGVPRPASADMPGPPL